MPMFIDISLEISNLLKLFKCLNSYSNIYISYFIFQQLRTNRIMCCQMKQSFFFFARAGDSLCETEGRYITSYQMAGAVNSQPIRELQFATVFHVPIKKVPRTAQPRETAF